jgi:two-component system cell cycle sensor histidine kinase/response regulator CckA
MAGEHAGPIHLMLTDVVMPGMSGPEAALQVARLRPQMKVLYVSGHTDEAVARHGDFGHGTAFLSKPFTTRTLLRKCRELLEQGVDVHEGSG